MVPAGDSGGEVFGVRPDEDTGRPPRVDLVDRPGRRDEAGPGLVYGSSPPERTPNGAPRLTPACAAWWRWGPEETGTTPT